MVITGVIRPPPDIRAVADKTALFVAKNGRAFEERILNSEKGKTPKFAFLQTTSPFHAYYEDRIRFHMEGGKEEEAPKEEEEKKQDDQKKEPAERKKEKAQKASAVDPVARALLEQRNKIQKARAAVEAHEEKNDDSSPPKGVVAPPPLVHVSAVAPKIPAVQIETIKCVAQFVALDGKGGPLLQQLAAREWNNPVFSFLQPRHGHFAYFSALVDGYRNILSTKADDAAELPTTVSQCLERAAYRAEYDRDVAERERAAQEEGGGGALSGASLIDWHDFVVVETIEFPADEDVQMTLAPPPPPPAATKADDTMEESDEEEEETIRVVPSYTYTPKVVSTRAVASSQTHVIDPITGKSVPVADMPEHMRIQLLDPKWAEERKKFQEKQKETNLVSGEAIASNISRFAGDLFGSSDLTTQGDGAKKRRIDEVNSGLPQPGPTMPPPPQPMDSAMQQQQQLPLPPPPPPMGGDALLPPTKRARMDVPGTVPPPMPPPPPPTGLAPPPIGMPPPPPPGMAMPPPLPTEGVPPEEPQAPTLLSEAEFAATLDSPMVHLTIHIPNDPTNVKWNLAGQTIALSIDVMSKIKAIKAELKQQLGGAMPINKMQLKEQGTGFLKDAVTLAQLNIGPTAKLELIPKTRGGRK